MVRTNQNGFNCGNDVPLTSWYKYVRRRCYFLLLDIDECKLSPAKCNASETCINFIGTFQCRG